MPVPFRKGYDPRRARGPGRPVIPDDVRDALRALTLPAIERLGKLIRGEDDGLALKAAQCLLNKTVPDAAVYEQDAAADLLDERLRKLTGERLEAVLDDLAAPAEH